MISSIGQFISGGFYQDRADIFDTAINSYNDNRDSDSREIIESLMVESGFREEDNCFIDLDKEFYTDGALDSDKCDNFKKELILYYSLDQLKTSFAGTQSIMTRITEDSLNREGKSLNDYMPVAKRRKNEKAKLKKEQELQKQNAKENKVPIYIYADASMSTTVNREKAKTTFNKLGGNGGTFDFSKGYDPNHKVENKSFLAGFDPSETWTEVKAAPETKDVQDISGDYEYSTPEVELLFDDEFVYLLDSDNLLLHGTQEEYYSVTGELYAKREIDREKSIESIKDALRSSGISSIKGIVLNDTDKETVKYYKENFSDFISEDTNITTSSDSEMSANINKVKEKQLEAQLSLDILKEFNELKEQNRTSDEIIQALESSDNYSAELDIFSNPDDMELFLSNEMITKDPEVTDYITTLEVQQDKSKELSRSFQNIISDKQLATTTGLSTIELLKKSKNIIADGNTTIDFPIVSKVSLSDYISNTPQAIDLSVQEDRDAWLKESVESSYSPELSEKIALLLASSDLTKADSDKIVTGINNMPEIAGSTGMTPLELVNNVVNNKNMNKNITKESDLTEIISNTSMSPSKKYNLQKQSSMSSTSFNLNNSGDVVKLVHSPLVKSHDDEKTRSELQRFLQSKPVPLKDSKEYSLDLVNALNNRSRMPKGSNSVVIARALADSYNGTDKDVNKLVSKSLKVYDSNEKPKYNLMDSSDLRSFKSDPMLSSVSDDDLSDLMSYLSTVPVSYKNSEAYSKAVIESIKTPTTIPANSSYADMARLLADNFNGTNNRGELLNSPVIKSLRLEDQTSLINYLDTTPVAVSKSQEYNSALIKGLENDKRGNDPTEIAKALANVINGNDTAMPEELAPLLTSSLSVASDTNKAVPLNYNFADRGDINRFKYDPLMANFSNSDQEELLSYLQSTPVAVKDSPQFTTSLLSGLNSLPKSVSPLSFASGLASNINRSTNSISKPTKNYNLLTSSGLSSFYRTNNFKSSGLSHQSFSNVVNSRRSSLSNYTPANSFNFPLSYRSVDTPISQATPTATNTPNNIYNQSHVVRNTPKQRPVTKNIAKQKRDAYTGVTTPVATQTQQTQQSNTTPVVSISNYQQPQVTPQQQIFTPPTQQQATMQTRPQTPRPTLTPEEEKMQRIQQNYLNDKQNIANGGGITSGQQMLAKSKSKDVGSAGGGTGGKQGSGRSVNELSDGIAIEVTSDLDISTM